MGICPGVIDQEGLHICIWVQIELHCWQTPFSSQLQCEKQEIFGQQSSAERGLLPPKTAPAPLAHVREPPRSRRGPRRASPQRVPESMLIHS